jgi:hypothetical protein
VVKVLGDNGSPAADAFLRISKYSDAVSLTTGFSASRDSNTSVKIEMPIVAGAALTQYEVSRAKTGMNGQIVQDWNTVVISAVQKITDTWGSPITVWRFYSTNADADSDWVYRLIVKYPDNSSIYGLSYTTVSALPAGTLRSLNLQWVPNSTYPATPNSDYDDLEAIGYLRYDIEADVDYTLYRKQTTGANGVTLPTGTAHDWELVSVATADKATGADSESVKVTLPQARTRYSFKVVATGRGSKAGYTGIEDTVNANLLNSIIPSGFGGSTALLSYDLSSGVGYTYVGAKYNTTGAQIGRLYRLNVNGLSGITSNLLRSGESLVVEYRNAGDVNSVYSTLGTPFTKPVAAVYGPTDTTSAGASDYYFVLPYNSTAPVNYEVRLVVNAK